jgi:hypothetical protein
MNRIKKIGLLILLIVGFSKMGLAGHLAGGEFSYKWVSSNGGMETYELVISLYISCAAVRGNDGSINTAYQVGTSANASFDYIRVFGTTANLEGDFFVRNVTFQTSTNGCNCEDLDPTGGNVFVAGNYFAKVDYHGLVTIPSNSSYVYEARVDRRHDNLGNAQLSNNDFVVKCMINASGVQTSPNFFSDLLIRKITPNQVFSFPLGGVDPNGDILNYQFTEPLGPSGSILKSPTYTASTIFGAGNTSTISGNGIFTGSCSVINNFQGAVKVTKTRSGTLMGWVVRDFLCISANFNNTPPALSEINQNQGYNLNMVAGSQSCFDIAGSDVDGDNINMFSSDLSSVISSALPIAFNSGNNQNGGLAPLGTICWTPTISDVGKTFCFTITLEDDACTTTDGQKPFGTVTQTYCITVIAPIICPEPELIITGECTSGATVFSLSPSTELAGATIIWDFGDGTTGSGISVAHYFTSAATYTATVTVSGPGNCKYTAQKEVTINCCECRTSFAPQPGKKYVLSAWVKETQPNLSGTNVPQQVQTYFAPEIELIFPSKTLGGYKAKGSIIEGWQKIEEVFTVPEGATQLKIKLNNTSGKYAIYFDDIRIHPFNSSMKSYVYDPVSLRLWSELDDRNYATFYEYDEQGNLTRIKKETERGVVTIQESREGKYKEGKEF